MAAFHNGEDAGTKAGAVSSNALWSFVADAKVDSSLLGRVEPGLAQEIGKKVFSFLLKPEEDLLTSCSLSEMGMDFLVAIEVRLWWKSVFGFDISVPELMAIGTLDDLGAHPAKGMLQMFHRVDI